jgi:sulfate adenylyltransferase
VQRIAWVAALVTRYGGIAVCAPIAPYESMRAQARAMVAEHGTFVLVHISTSLEACERRDRKGLYAKARRGEIRAFTGISDPYEAPTDADVTIDTEQVPVADAVERVLDHLRGRRLLAH